VQQVLTFNIAFQKECFTFYARTYFLADNVRASRVMNLPPQALFPKPKVEIIYIYIYIALSFRH